MSPTPSVSSERDFQNGDAAELGRESEMNGNNLDRKQQRHSMTNTARDPADEPDSPGSTEESGPDGKEIRPTSLMTDLDGLTRPGTS